MSELNRRELNMRIIVLAVVALTSAALQVRAADHEPNPSQPKTAAPSPQRGFKDVNVQEFEKLRATGKVVVLDVRTPREFAAGHAPGAVNIDVKASDFEKKVKDLDPNKTYLVYCGAGVRSANACGKMSKLNFGELYNLAGGFNAWQKAGHKTEK
jgi:rhodanese-related sulfurtransferase